MHYPKPLLALAALLAAVPAIAHDLYILPERFAVKPGETITIGLHNGDAFPESETFAAVKRLRDTVVLNGGKTSQILDLKEAPNRTVGRVTIAHPGPAVVALRTEPNLIELDPAKFEAYLREEGLARIIEWRKTNGEAKRAGRERYSKYAKSILNVSAGPAPAAGHLIEIIPEDSAALKPGATATVRVLFRGAPAAGLQLESAYSGAGGKRLQVAGVTDKDGRVKVKLGAAGLYRLHTIVMERCKDAAAADWESFWASLTFELK